MERATERAVSVRGGRQGRAGDGVIAVAIAASPVASAVGTVHRLGAEPLVIERVQGEGAEDTLMSRRHATVVRTGDGRGVALSDGASNTDGGHKGSVNGTWVGEQPVRDPVYVPLGGSFRTGDTLWVVLQDPSPTAPDSLLVGISSSAGASRDELELVTSQVALRLERGQRVTQALLVTGARGTGKQIVAREAHRLLSAKRKGETPLRQVAAPALSDGTAAADLFGVVDRYATDVKARQGHFQLADKGVLFLDEIGDLPMAEQVKLLNVLQEREVLPLGGTRPIPFDCLVIAATNRDLASLCERGLFREDLYDRLGRFVVSLPTLDQRREDIPFLARALLARHGFTAPLHWSLVQALMARRWPGNVRELDAALERAVALAEVEGTDRLTPAMLDAWHNTTTIEPAELAGASAPRPTSNNPTAELLAVGRHGWPARHELLAELEASGWNKTEVGRRYGKHPRQIVRWMQYLDIESPS